MRFCRYCLIWPCLLFLISLISLSALNAAAQTAPNEWTWTGGSNSNSGYGPGGVYGTKGVAAATNAPGGRAGAVSWTDRSGNVWLMGGYGVDSVGKDDSELNDLWKFASGQWIWITGSNVAEQISQVSGVYGTMGTPSASNTPGGRNGAVSWTDSNGNLWLFGGIGYDSMGTEEDGQGGYLNDLWEFSTSTSEWTWMGGSNSVAKNCTSAASSGVVTYCGMPGVYGTQGTAAPGNAPGGRYEAVSWTDLSGNFWLFGGIGVDSAGNLGYLNDLWEFNSTTRQWTWVGGSNAAGCTNCGQPGIYGTLGTAASKNWPGGRQGATVWVDRSGNFWLFGGEGFASAAGITALNDLWEFIPAKGQWTWMSGSNIGIADSTAGQPGVYGVLGVAAEGNTPGARDLATGWADSAGNLWLFGGQGTDSTNSGISGLLDDLWVFNSSKQWAWMGGDNTLKPLAQFLPTEIEYGALSIYGSLGVPSAGNTPGGRAETVGWTDSSGNFWLFGGDGFGAASNDGIAHFAYLGDLWRFEPSDGSLPPVLMPLINPPTGTYTTPQSVTIMDQMSNATIYYTLDGSTPTTGSSVYSGAIPVSSTETIQAIAAATGYPDSGVASSTLTFPPAAATPTFSMPAGTYGAPIQVALSDATAGATIYYTRDGTAPTSTSTIYNGSGPISITSSETVQAIAIANGYSNSAVASASYLIGSARPILLYTSPSFTSAGGVAFTLTVNGLGFTSGSTILWGGQALTTQYVSSSQLTTQVPASAIASAGVQSITIQNAGGTSGAFEFEVDSGVSGLTTIPNPTETVPAGAEAFYTVSLPSGATNVSVRCLNLPTGAACGYSSNSSLTITTAGTTATGAYQITAVFTETLPGSAAAAGLLVLPILLLPLAAMRRKGPLPGASLVAWIGIALLCGMAGTGCGGGGSQSAPQAHQVTSSAAVTLTVQ